MTNNAFLFTPMVQNETSIWDVRWVITKSLIITTMPVMMIIAKIPAQAGS